MKAKMRRSSAIPTRRSGLRHPIHRCPASDLACPTGIVRCISFPPLVSTALAGPPYPRTAPDRVLFAGWSVLDAANVLRVTLPGRGLPSRRRGYGPSRWWSPRNADADPPRPRSRARPAPDRASPHPCRRPRRTLLARFGLTASFANASRATAAPLSLVCGRRLRWGICVMVAAL